MSNRYKTRFAQLKSEGKRAFMPFTLLGWPDRDTSLKLIKQMIDSGASALELGIAFSDPIADGPIIQSAATETLASGFKLDDAFELLKEVRKLDQNIPIGLLVYFNMVLSQGVGKFFQRAKQAGVDGILVADLPAENVDELMPYPKEHEIDPILLVSPLTSTERLGTILKHASGFIYLLSRLGVTGTQRTHERDAVLKKLIETIHSKTDVPVCAGFGISTVTDAKTMFDLGADGVISGSKVVQLATSSRDSKNFQPLADYYKEMLAATSLVGA
jgi:tryptophan synthase alpha chain